MYEPVYVEPPLEFGWTPAETYGQYTLRVGRLLSKPNAGAFLMVDGFTSWIALTYEPDVLRMFMASPSTQVTKYH
jgi:hypothetical protein